MYKLIPPKVEIDIKEALDENQKQETIVNTRKFYEKISLVL